MGKLLFVLVLSATSLFAGEPEKGTICFGIECTPAIGSSFEVKPGDVGRRFVWTSADGSKFILGTLPAKATSVDLEQKDARNVALSVRGDAQRGWPVETRFAVAPGKDSGWGWSVPARVMAKPISIRLLSGSYSMQIAAAHHMVYARPMRIATADLPLQVVLVALPAVSGRVVTMKTNGDGKGPKETAAAGAHIAGSDGKTLASANEQGAFRVELNEPVTQELVVISPGLGMRVIPLKLRAADTDLGVITLSAGVKLAVHVDRSESVKSKVLHVQLSDASKSHERTLIAAQELKAGQEDLAFSDLAEGAYYLTLNGDGALEHLTMLIPIKTEDVSKEIHLSPFLLLGSVHFGSEPLREGQVSVWDRDQTWRAEVPIDNEGHFGGPMWQAGTIGGGVASKEIGFLPVDGDPNLTDDPATWDITFRRRLISGRIFDAETKEPIENAGLHLQLEPREIVPTPGSRFYSTIHVEDDGTYSIAAPRDGVYDLAVTAPDHLAANATIELTDREESKTADFPLSRGIEQAIDFVWSTGEPVRNATVIEGVSRDGHNAIWQGHSDATGRLTLRLRAGETKTLFVMPGAGSFAPVHVVAADGKPMKIVVPQPLASLVVNFVDAENKPVMARAAMRWNGEWLPGSVVMRLHVERTGAGSLRFLGLPAGSYEIWGTRGFQQAFAPPPVEPVRVGLGVGEQAVEVVVP
jgi:hypothetical protein